MALILGAWAVVSLGGAALFLVGLVAGRRWGREDAIARLENRLAAAGPGRPVSLEFTTYAVRGTVGLKE